MTAWKATDSGLHRSENQDWCEFCDFNRGKTVFLAVCDGMGGARGGKEAGELAGETVFREMKERLRPGMTREEYENTIKYAVREANRAVYFKSCSQPEFAGMGTTIVCALIENGTAIIANIGDSRAYVINWLGAFCKTRDHSLVEELVRKGEISQQNARFHPKKNIITKALGVEPDIDPDVFVEDIDGFLLLCSDGLTNMVSDEEIHDIVYNTPDKSEVCQKLIDAANRNGGSDNITVVLIDPAEEDEQV